MIDVLILMRKIAVSRVILVIKRKFNAIKIMPMVNNGRNVTVFEGENFVKFFKGLLSIIA